MTQVACHRCARKPATAATVSMARSRTTSLPSRNAFPSGGSAFLASYVPYIQGLLRKKASPGLEEEVNDVTQEVLFTLWRRTIPGQDAIESLDAYLTSIVNSRWIDAARKRQRQPTIPLLEADGEPSQEAIRSFPGEGMDDPAIEYERKEFIEEVIYAVTQLPSTQMKAMVCTLRDEIGKVFPLTELFAKYGTDIRSIVWPDNNQERQSWMSSLSIARKKLRPLKQRYCLA